MPGNSRAGTTIRNSRVSIMVCQRRLGESFRKGILIESKVMYYEFP